MKLLKHKTCNNCLAHSEELRKCLLGFEIKATRFFVGAPIEWKPLEPCYRPITNNSHKLALELAKSIRGNVK